MTFLRSWAGALPLILGAGLFLSGCTSRFSETFSDGSCVEAVTISNLWSPNITVVRTPDGVTRVFSGSSSMGQLAGPASVAYAGHEVGQGLESSGDQISVSQAQDQGQDAAASASSDVEVDIDTPPQAQMPKKKWP